MGHRARVIWVNVLATCGLLLALELAARLVGHVGLPDPLITDQRLDWYLSREYDPLLFWRMRPGVERDGERLTNSLGLRGPEVEDKVPDELRILSLGESTTFGIRLRYEDTYSARLQELMAAGLDRPVRVVNAGAPGYSLLQGVVYFEHRGLALEPDIVLIYFGYNDFLPVAFRRRRDAEADRSTGGVSDLALFERRRRPGFRLTHFFARHSNFARLLLFGRQQYGEVTTDESTPRVPEGDRKQLLARLLGLCDDRGVQLVVVVPWYREFEEHAPLLREFCARHGVPMVDLPRELAHLPRPRADYFVDSVHPSADGHELIAIAVESRLNGILSSPEQGVPRTESGSATAADSAAGSR